MSAFSWWCKGLSFAAQPAGWIAPCTCACAPIHVHIVRDGEIGGEGGRERETRVGGWGGGGAFGERRESCPCSDFTCSLQSIWSCNHAPDLHSYFLAGIIDHSCWQAAPKLTPVQNRQHRSCTVHEIQLPGNHCIVHFNLVASNILTKLLICFEECCSLQQAQPVCNAT